MSSGLFLFFGPGRAIAAEESAAASPTSPYWQALTQVTSEDGSVREAAIRVLIEQGDASLVPRLEEIRADASRSIRLAIKPLMDLLKNRAKLASPDSDVRRSAATDLGSSGNPVGDYMVGCRSGERAEQVGALHDGRVCGAAQARVGRSIDQSHCSRKARRTPQWEWSAGLEGAWSRLGAGAEATESQKVLAKAAATAIDRIETWGDLVECD